MTVLLLGMEVWENTIIVIETQVVKTPAFK